MISTATTHDVLAAVSRAKNILVSGYILRPGSVVTAIESAARTGARVTLRLEGRPYAGGNPTEQAQLLEGNREAVAAIRAAGGDAALTDLSDSQGPPLHLKAIVCDGVAYLDDRNFPGDGSDTILRDDFAADAKAVSDAVLHRPPGPTRWFWTKKASAVAAEARLLYGAHSASHVEVESESFGVSPQVYGALKHLAQAGVTCELLVSQRDVNDRSRIALQHLQKDGVDVRTGDFDEKMAVVDGKRAWTGSANATRGLPDQIDWGIRTDSPGVIAALESHFKSHWSASHEFSASP